MVQLTKGTPLSWPEIQAVADHVRKHGVLQFINLYNRTKDRQDDILYWGDEIEYMLIRFDDTAKKATLSLRAEEILHKLQNCEGTYGLWKPEYNNFVLEGIPAKPYNSSLADIKSVEVNMKHRRKEVLPNLDKNESLLTLASFPSTPAHEPKPESSASGSLFLPDEIVFPDPFFHSLISNIQGRRGGKIAVNVPLFIDTATPKPFSDNFVALGYNGETGTSALADHIYMDDMSFGLSCCSLQITFQACDLSEARILHDQLAIFGPIMLALTAASPLHRGLIADTDCRWNILSGSLDSRTKQERGLEPLTTARHVVPKSPWSSLSTYITPEAEKYNDTPLVYDEDAYDTLTAAGVDSHLAKHVAYLFLRDVFSLLKEQVDHSDEELTDFFDIHQLTTWQNVRFKPPSPNGAVGWRVEFRTCEVQITDFENAAVATFLLLLRRVMHAYKLNFLVPISKGDDNMERAQKRNAVLNQKFWFRTDILTEDSPKEAEEFCCKNCSNPSWSELTINEIVNGKEGLFVGLVPLVNSYLETEECEDETRQFIQRYLEFIQRRANGELMTDARWIRNFVTNHHDYKHDSFVSDIINYDLLKTIEKLVNDEANCTFLSSTRAQNGEERTNIPVVQYLSNP